MIPTWLRLFLLLGAVSALGFHFDGPRAWVCWIFLVLSVLAAGLAIYADINLRRAFRYVAHGVESLGSDGLAALYAEMGSAGGEEPTAHWLGRTGRKAADQRLRVAIPVIRSGLPWEGRAIAIDPPPTHPDALDELRLHYLADAGGASSIRGEEFAAVGVPRKATKSGKGRNLLQFETNLKRSPALARAVGEAFPRRAPEKALEYLLLTFGSPAGKWGQDYGYCNALIGAHPQWIQNPEFPDCPVCKKRMRHIFEVSASTVVPQGSEGQLNVFGCPRHPEELAYVIQFS